MSLNDTTHETPVKLCECGCGQPAPIMPVNYDQRGLVKGQSFRFIHGHNGRRPVEKRFWEKVDKEAKNGCWEWTGARQRKGYGVLKVDGKAIAMHRYSYELHCGPIPAGMMVCHACDNPCCVNPAHLFLGTPADNMTDKVSKGRAKGPWSVTQRG